MTDSHSYESELKQVTEKLKQVEADLLILKEKREKLKERKEFLTDRISLQQSKEAAEDDRWGKTNFSWYSKLEKNLKDVFKLQTFRSNQLSAINATLSKKDVIVIMPTGGGKSLCYQLPTLVENGFTLVISPMLSLIEDQVIQLKSLSIKAEMFYSSSTPEETRRIQEMMTDSKSGLKLVYATPEKLAKSKRFMTKLQKSYTCGLLNRIAIDEVHCCSQWGHDFRTDYQFLSVFKGMFPDVPMIGLTATATAKVILDVQKMLLIQGCLVLKSSFNRPNLFYEIREKPSNQKDCIDLLENMLKHRFKNESGIIYTTSVKDCDDLRQELRKRDCRVSSYHAQMDSNLRSKVHQKWLSGEYQAVVATIAFGLGIDKPNVRFVIHHALSKSMENFYQESGRAGRDGKHSTCIVLYRFADIFKLSTMVFTQQTGLRNLYSVIDYCSNYSECRRKLIAAHFDETWESTDCKKMCDNCKFPRKIKKIDLGEHCRNLYKILDRANDLDVRLTAQMLIDTWFGKDTKKLKVKVAKMPTFSTEIAGNILVYLMMNGYLKEDFHFTPYSTISYVKKGIKFHDVTINYQILMTTACSKSSDSLVEEKLGGKRKISESGSAQLTEITKNSKMSKLFKIDSSSENDD